MLGWLIEADRSTSGIKHADAASGSAGRGAAGAPNGRTMEVLPEHSAAPPPLESRQNVWDRLVGSRAADLSAS